MVMKRHYQIYLIKERLAGSYIGREQLLFTLFHDYHHSQGEQTRIIGRQIVYVTKRIPIQTIERMIESVGEETGKQKMENSIDYQIDCRSANGLTSTARVEIHNRVIHIYAEGTFDAETIFFECIRKSAPSYMAFELSQNRYGWLKPMKARNLI
ncbi:sporulation inhibitor of replication protein SirA [Bacillus testis]|uniref:sporulation inhibitor of replication protein SirA n=1 Tax=Bacillus testis TaxID=1622072 RepID=UPI00067ED8AE|nr:sporulation inhibitor of replication protein SirA [Bacillus testis]